MAKAQQQQASIREYVERITQETIPLDLIDNHESNYNFHPETQLEDLKKSYERRGQFLPKLVWKRPNGRYTLVIGEGFTGGARRAGAETIRAEVLPEDTPPEYVKEILLADNLHARNSVPDDELLATLLKEQQLLGVSLESLGSDEETLRQMLAALGDGVSPEDIQAPEAFKEYDEEIEIEYACPKCGYQWSGQAKQATV